MSEAPYVRWADAHLCQVTARLECGFVVGAGTLWPLMLDGILDAQWWVDHPEESAKIAPLKGTKPKAGEQRRHIRNAALPLARAGRDGATSMRFWLATMAMPRTSEKRTAFLVGRPDVAMMHEMAASSPKDISTNGGRFKAWRKPFEYVACSHIDWLAWGDPKALAEQLNRVTHVGKYRGHGWGSVLGWSVETLDGPPLGAMRDFGDAATEMILWGKTGGIRRAVSARWRGHAGIPASADVVDMPYRPPYFTLTTKPGRECPGSVAPWTQRCAS